MKRHLPSEPNKAAFVGESTQRYTRTAEVKMN